MKHIIESSIFPMLHRLTTKNRHNPMICSQEVKVTEKLGACNLSVGCITKDPTTLP